MLSTTYIYENQSPELMQPYNSGPEKLNIYGRLVYMNDDDVYFLHPSLVILIFSFSFFPSFIFNQVDFISIFKKEVDF